MRTILSRQKVLEYAKYCLLITLFMLCINPITAHATSTSNTSNCKDSVTTTSSTESANVTNKSDRTPGYYPYAGSVHRQGIIFYIVKSSKSNPNVLIADTSFQGLGFMIHEPYMGELRKVDKILGTCKANNYGMSNFTTTYQNLLTAGTSFNNYPNWLPTPVTEVGTTWKTQGKKIGEKLLEKTTYNGEERAYWEVLILDYYRQVSPSERQAIIDNLKSGEDETLTLVIEPIAANCLYGMKSGSDEIFPVTKYDDKLYSLYQQSVSAAGDYVRQAPEAEKQALKDKNLVVLGTPTGMASYINGLKTLSIANFTRLFNSKWAQYILPTSLTLSYDQLEIYKTADTSSYYSIDQLRTRSPSVKFEGKVWGLGIGMFNNELGDSVIHTYDGHRTPGPTEDPEPDKTGICVIKKLYVKKIGSRYETVTHTYITSEVLFFLLIFRINNISKASIS